jgi:5-methylcytosine-specific restriction endonuclease McrA
VPHALVCLDCGDVTTEPRKGCCPDCARARDRADPYQSPEWRAKAKALKKRLRECAICGGTERLTAHHKQARKAGGPDEEANLMLLCGSCHSQYEADKRAGKDTELRRLVDSL